MQGRKAKIVCDFVSFLVSIIVIAVITLDILSDINLGYRIFLVVTSLELFFLAINARFKKISSKSVERLDETCQLNKEQLSKLNKNLIKIGVISLASFAFDVIGLKLLNFKNTTIVFLSVAFAAHDVEFGYFSLLFESMNARLEMLKESLPSVSSRRFGHILVASSYLSEQCAPAVRVF